MGNLTQFHTKKWSPFEAKSQIEYLDDFKSWAFKNFQINIEGIEPGAKPSRYPSPGKDKGQDCSAQCFLTTSGIVMGWVQDFIKDSSRVTEYRPDKCSGATLTVSQVAEIDGAVQARRVERKKEVEKALNKITSDLNGYGKAPQDHPYLVRKGIECPEALDGGRNRLAFPIVDKDGTVFGVQYISNTKKIINGTLPSGQHILLKGDDKKTIICEGVSTGCSIRELTGATVICAINAGNIMKVASVFKGNNVWIAADNDWSKKINAGLEFATKASEKHGIPMLVPEFAGQDGSDWNDLALLNKQEAIRQLSIVASAKNKFEEAEFLSDNFDCDPIEFLFKDFFEAGVVNALVAPGGVGKSLICLGQAIMTATGKHLFGPKIKKTGVVVYYNAEDSLNSIKLRLHAICTKYNVDMDLVRKNLKIISGQKSNDAHAPLKIATLVDKEVLKGRDWDDFNDYLKSRNPVALYVDPLVKIHDVSENDNSHMDRVAELLGSFDVPGITTVFVHHTGKTEAVDKMRKNSDPFRGASSLRSAIRSGWMVTELDEKERKYAVEIGQDPDQIMYLSNIKANNFKPCKPFYLEKYLFVNNNVIDSDGDSTIVAVAAATDFEDQYKRRAKADVVEKEGRECRALKWLHAELKDGDSIKGIHEKVQSLIDQKTDNGNLSLIGHGSGPKSAVQDILKGNPDTIGRMLKVLIDSNQDEPLYGMEFSISKGPRGAKTYRGVK